VVLAPFGIGTYCCEVSACSFLSLSHLYGAVWYRCILYLYIPKWSF
jgi:hypothetical protein